MERRPISPWHTPLPALHALLFASATRVRSPATPGCADLAPTSHTTLSHHLITSPSHSSALAGVRRPQEYVGRGRRRRNLCTYTRTHTCTHAHTHTAHIRTALMQPHTYTRTCTHIRTHTCSRTYTDISFTCVPAAGAGDFNGHAKRSYNNIHAYSQVCAPPHPTAPSPPPLSIHSHLELLQV